jgi:hypothetical protein
MPNKNNLQLLISGLLVLAFVFTAVLVIRSSSYTQLSQIDNSNAANQGHSNKPNTNTTPVPTTETGSPDVVPLPSDSSTQATESTFLPTRTLYVSPTGNDSYPGTPTQPFKTLKKGLSALIAGDLLYVRAGTYTERIQNPSIKQGTATSPIQVKSYPGERVLVKGLFWLSNLSYWNIDGINVTWDSATGVSTEHMVKFSGGLNWTYSNAEVSEARSFAGILVTGGAVGWNLKGLFVHDTYLSNATNQDHLIYINNASKGIVERSLFKNSANGRGIKLGPPSETGVGPNNIIIRYNTFYNNTGPSNIQLSYGSHDNEIYRNILQKPGSTESNITGYNLTGINNKVHDNIGWESKSVMQTSAGLTNGGNNTMLNPLFQNIAANDFRPQNTTAQAYGKFAL